MKRHAHLFSLAAALCALTPAMPALAQPKEKIGVATVTFAAACPHADKERDASPGAKSATAFLPIIGDFVGNLVGGGLTILSEALGEASRASAIGGEGRATFDYYLVDSDTGKRSARIGSGDMACLIVVVPELPAGPMSPGTERREMLIVEAELIPLSSGFVVEPVYVHYQYKLPGGSDKRLAAELHVTLAGPLSYSNGTAGESIFAVARIILPKLMPGDEWKGNDLTVRSGILPHRTPDTSAETDPRVAAVQNLRTARRTEDTAFRKIASLLGLVGTPGNWKCDDFAYACIKTAGRGPVASVSGLAELALKTDSAYSDAARTEIATAIATHRTAQHDRAVAEAALEAIVRPYDAVAANGDRTPDKATQATSGSTSLTARVFILTNEKRFLKLLSTALASAATSVKPVVSGAIQGDPAWTSADTHYALAMAAVREKELALQATNPADPIALEKARTEVIKAKADANEKAVAAGRAIPFPGL